MRKEDNKMIKRICHTKEIGKKNRGRTRKTWQEEVSRGGGVDDNVGDRNG